VGFFSCVGSFLGALVIYMGQPLIFLQLAK